ncbi:hypothetical protein Tco_0948667 [Tanacetum coccineum]
MCLKKVPRGGGGTLGRGDVSEFKLPLVDGDVDDVGDLVSRFDAQREGHHFVQKKWEFRIVGSRVVRESLEVIEFESAQSNTIAKLPILKLAQENGTFVTKMSVLVTAKEKTNKKNDVKARSLLLMALPSEHQLTFSYASSTKSIDSIFNRLQKIVSRLAILGVVITHEDLNSKILSSFPPEWNTHVISVGASSGAQNLAFMTAPSSSSTNDVNTAKPAYEDIEKIHEDDLEAMDLKWQLSLLSMRGKRVFQLLQDGTLFQRVQSTKEQEGQFRCQDNTRKHENNEDTSSKEMLAKDVVGFDWSDMTEEQVQTNMALTAFLDSKVYNDKTCSKTCLKNYEALKKQCDDLIVKLNQTKFTTATYKRGLATIEGQLITYRKNEVLFSEEVAVLKREVACKDYEINVLKSLDEFKDPKFKDPEFKSYGSEDSKQESNIVCDKKSDASKENFDDSLVKDQVSEDTSSFVESPLNVDKETIFLDKKIEIVKPKNHEKPVKKPVRVNYNYTTNRTHPNAQRNMVPRAILMKTGLKTFNTARWNG